MTLINLKNASTSEKIYRDLLKNIKGKQYVSEEALISEEAEKLYNSNKYIFSKLKDTNTGKNCFLLKKCFINYKSFDNVVEDLRKIIVDNSEKPLDKETIFKLYKLKIDKSRYVKLSTFNEAIGFLNL